MEWMRYGPDAVLLRFADGVGDAAGANRLWGNLDRPWVLELLLQGARLRFLRPGTA